VDDGEVAQRALVHRSAGDLELAPEHFPALVDDLVDPVVRDHRDGQPCNTGDQTRDGHRDKHHVASVPTSAFGCEGTP
jgi:hypothetical protein